MLFLLIAYRVDWHYCYLICCRHLTCFNPWVAILLTDRVEMLSLASYKMFRLFWYLLGGLASLEGRSADRNPFECCWSNHAREARAGGPLLCLSILSAWGKLTRTVRVATGVMMWNMDRVKASPYSLGVGLDTSPYWSGIALRLRLIRQVLVFDPTLMIL